MTKLEFINKVFFQWFFVRLARVVDNETNLKWYSIMGFILPLTGWSSDYKCLGKTWLRRITKKKIIKKCD